MMCSSRRRIADPGGWGRPQSYWMSHRDVCNVLRVRYIGTQPAVAAGLSVRMQVGVTQLAYYPLLTLSGAAGFEASSFGSWLTTASSFWSAGPAALINVLDFGRRRAANEQA